MKTEMTSDTNTNTGSQTETETKTETQTQTDGDRDERWPGVSEERRERYRQIEEENGLGLVEMWWGDGKGKTTAALGMAVRAAGHGYDVLLLQFMKGKAPGHGSDDEPGEIDVLRQIPEIDVERSGEYGWVSGADSSEKESHERAARLALEEVEEDLREGNYDMVILDEVLYAVSKGLVSEEEVIDAVKSRAQGVEAVLTGSHDRLEEIEETADLVTNVKKIKHPFDANIPARRGTEY
ncbi:MAG: cob(I)yrinic acid a,c-diamide adenosyltransferase [Halobacteria archaeon]|nr:cob(I)yrinic acid a,c-diamide adenosyltransferase [Halobacteria archaeon]